LAQSVWNYLARLGYSANPLPYSIPQYCLFGAFGVDRSLGVSWPIPVGVPQSGWPAA
jgi:hypothetical protein